MIIHKLDLTGIILKPNLFLAGTQSKKIIDYKFAISYMEEKLIEVKNNTAKELIWFLEHPSIFTTGASYNESDIIDKSILGGFIAKFDDQMLDMSTKGKLSELKEKILE